MLGGPRDDRPPHGRVSSVRADEDVALVRAAVGGGDFDPPGRMVHAGDAFVREESGFVGDVVVERAQEVVAVGPDDWVAVSVRVFTFSRWNLEQI